MRTLFFSSSLNKKIMSTPPTFKYNPFAGIDQDEVMQILVPRFDVEDILKFIQSDKKGLVELIGRQGRGKTTHLVYLHQRLPNMPIYFLEAGTEDYHKILEDTSEMVLIDSIHHLNVLQRHQVFKSKRLVIFTTHYTRRFEGWLARKSLKQLKFKGINTSILKTLIEKRLQMAAYHYTDDLMLSDTEIKLLIAQHGDNYRVIVNYLYDKFQNHGSYI
jgi:hypothetical protein